MSDLSNPNLPNPWSQFDNELFKDERVEITIVLQGRDAVEFENARLRDNIAVNAYGRKLLLRSLFNLRKELYSRARNINPTP
jgi:hypothetical protein